MSDWEVDYAYSTQCSAVAINTYAMLDDRPCKVTEISSSDGKITLAGRDLFTGDNHKQNFGSDWRVTVPNVTREVRLPEGDMGTEIRAKFDPDSDKTK
ncbi:Eukaryotic translation initiation factor 5A-2, partial [Mortierella sp. GBA43]